MKIGRMLITVICVILSVVLITQLYGCGTLIYPERRGQKTGRVDVGIALLDALWLLVFIVPGVVAFAVDLQPVPSIFLVEQKSPPVRVKPGRSLWFE